ncbi:MAG: hypothetical protein BGP05_21970 [Rhizobiales bacterium 62-47]|nr:hypothetical protein [Hyphomicrobiales bacterium]OJY10339.1 MAG: hypothetical protein BGP05_21970 [Rhizobiales bacterium 62-47]
MSEQDTMRLVAEVVDKFSGPLKDLTGALKEINKTAKTSHGEAAKAAREHARHLKELGERMNKAREIVVAGLTPTMAALGVTTFGASEAMGKFTESLKRAGEQYNIFSDAAKRGGVSAGHVDAISMAFQRLGVTQDKAISSVAELGGHLDRLSRGSPEELNAMTSTFGNMGAALASALNGVKGRESQMQALFNFFAKHPDVPVDQKRKFFEALSIPPELATKNGKELREAFDAGFAWEKAHPLNMKLFQELNEAFDHLRESQQGFERDMINTFGGAGPKLVTQFAHTVEAVSHEFRWWIETIAMLSNKSGLTEWLSRPSFDKTDPKHQWKNNDHWFGGKAVGPDPEKPIAEGTKKGVIEALREWTFENKVTEAEKFAGGYQPMAYHPDGDTGGSASPFPRVKRSIEGFHSGGGFKVLPNGSRDDDGPAARPGDGGGRRDAGLSGRTHDRIATAKTAMMDQLRREGVPEANLDTAASMLAGQAIAESNLNPNLPHDGGTGYGIYGARLDRRSRMLKWLRKNGYADNSLEGQSRYMAHEAMSDRYRRSRRALMNASPETMRSGNAALTEEFENPAVKNYGARLRATMGAKSVRPKEIDGTLLKNGAQSGLMGPIGGKLTGDASLRIDLNGFPKGTRTSATADGIFKAVRLNRSMPMPLASDES